MATGPGKYDELCTYVREMTQAESVLLIITNGNQGSGFSAQAHSDMLPALPAVLVSLAESIRNDMAGDNSGPMSDQHTLAFTVLTLGKAAGFLGREDIRSALLESLQRGTLNPGYLVLLRDRLDEVLQASKGAAVTSATPNP